MSFLVALVVVLGAGGLADAQVPLPESDDLLAEAGELAEAVDEELDDDGDEKGLSFVALPIPIVEPTLGAGLVAVGMALYDLGQDAPPSLFFVAATYTDTDSWGCGAFQGVHTDDDRWRLLGGAFAYELNTKFFGIGEGAGDRDRYVPLRHDGWVAMAQAKREVVTDFYLAGGLPSRDIAAWRCESSSTGHPPRCPRRRAGK